MESFSLLKYWRTSGVGLTAGDSTTNSRATTNTTFTTVSPDFSDDEEGPYFDLEFTLPDDNKDSDNEEGNIIIENENETELNKSPLLNEELKLTIESGDCTEDENVKVSTDELLLKGNLVSIEPSSILLNVNSEENSKIPVSLRKPATKFRVLLLKLKKSKSGNGVVEKFEKSEGINNGQKLPTLKMQEKQGGKQSVKFFTVKLKVQEVQAPLVSYFTRDNSSKQNHCKRFKNRTENSSDSNAASDERKLTKEVVQKYLNMVKLKVSGHLSFRGGDSKNGDGAFPPPAGTAEEPPEVVTSCVSVKANLKQGNNNLQAGLKVVKKHLGKSRSAPAAAPPPPPGKMAAERRDDSLLQLQDGIQGAILHCKRSFNGSRDGESSLVLSRSASDPSASSYSGEAKEIKV